MEEFVSTRYNSISNPIRKKRTQTSRRPRPESHPQAEWRDNSPSSSTPPSDDVSKVSSDENASGDTNSRRKEFNLNQFVSRVPSAAAAESEKLHEKYKRDAGFNAFYNNEPGRSGFNNKRSSEGVLAPANWKSTSRSKDGFESELRSVDKYGGRNGEGVSSGQAEVLLDGSGNENKVKMVKLKVGGVTRTIQANTISNGALGGGSSSKSSSHGSKQRQKQNVQVANCCFFQA